jgi:hypothetical protein
MLALAAAALGLMLLLPVRPSPAEPAAGDKRAEGNRIGTVQMPFDGFLSAGIYDNEGRLIRTLYAHEPRPKGPADLMWDGRDEAGNVVANGQWEWRALVSQVTSTHEQSIADAGDPATGLDEDNGFVQDLADDAEGNLYMASFWEEAHHEIRKVRPDGSSAWGVALVGSYSITTDGTHVFAARSATQHHWNSEIFRLDAQTGKPAPFPGKNTHIILVDTNDPKNFGTRDMDCLRGLATDSKRLWVSDHYKDRIIIFDKLTGDPIVDAKGNPVSLAVKDPTDLTVQSEPAGGAPGVLWIAHSGDRVSKFLYTIDAAGNYAFREEIASRIANLSDPTGVDIGGSAGHLYVAEAGKYRILEFDISGRPTPAGLKSLGERAKPGPVTHTGFRSINSVAVDPQGRISVTDIRNCRVQRFWGEGEKAGQWFDTMFSDFQPVPFIDKITETSHRVLCGQWEYEVDLSGKKHPDWMGNKTWRLYANWMPEDENYYSWYSIRRTLEVKPGVKKDFLFFISGTEQTPVNSGGLSIYALEEGGMRRSAIVGNTYWGPDGKGPPKLARYSWADSNGDGVIQEEEIKLDPEQKWEEPYHHVAQTAYSASAPGVWVDEAGNFWIANYYFSHVAKVPLQGFDDHGNPLYDWSKREIVIGQHKGYETNQIRIAPNGDIYVQCKTLPRPPRDYKYASGGSIIRRHNSKGEFLSMCDLLHVGECPAFAVDPEPDSPYWYAAINIDGWHGNPPNHGVGAWVDVRTHDNLLVVSAIGEPEPGLWHAEMADMGMAVGVMMTPGDKGTRRIYLENVGCGSLMRYRVDGLDTVQRFSDRFTWRGAPPTKLEARVVPGDDTKIELSWPAVEGVSGFNVYRVRNTPIQTEAKVSARYGETWTNLEAVADGDYYASARINKPEQGQEAKTGVTLKFAKPRYIGAIGILPGAHDHNPQYATMAWSAVVGDTVIADKQPIHHGFSALLAKEFRPILADTVSVDMAGHWLNPIAGLAEIDVWEYERIATLPADATRHIDGGRTPGVSYAYFVTSIADDQESFLMSPKACIIAGDRDDADTNDSYADPIEAPQRSNFIRGNMTAFPARGTPPAAPLNARIEGGAIVFDASPTEKASGDVQRYRIFRADGDGSKLADIQTQALPENGGRGVITKWDCTYLDGKVGRARNLIDGSLDTFAWLGAANYAEADVRIDFGPGRYFAMAGLRIYQGGADQNPHHCFRAATLESNGRPWPDPGTAPRRVEFTNDQDPFCTQTFNPANGSGQAEFRFGAKNQPPTWLIGDHLILHLEAGQNNPHHREIVIQGLPLTELPPIPATGQPSYRFTPDRKAGRPTTYFIVPEDHAQLFGPPAVVTVR